MFIYQLKSWPEFEWEINDLADLLAKVRFKQGNLTGRMQAMGFNFKSEASLSTLTLDVLKSSEIEGETLNLDQVRSSLAKRLGLDIVDLVPSDRHVDGVVEMMLDATQEYASVLTKARLNNWHGALFPTGRSGMAKITVGAWRNNSKEDPMQVVSGPLGRQRVHFTAPDSEALGGEMQKFLRWFNDVKHKMDPVIKAAVAHLWFVTTHPFDDGNGRIARAITDMQLTRSDDSPQRFYSMSAQIRLERKKYYEILESTQKGDLDITAWLEWFLTCLDRSLDASNEILAAVIDKARFWEENATTSFNERQKLMINKLLDGFIGKLTSSKWAKIAKCSQDTAGRDINDLVNRSILTRSAEGGRSTSYLLKDLPQH